MIKVPQTEGEDKMLHLLHTLVLHNCTQTLTDGITLRLFSNFSVTYSDSMRILADYGMIHIIKDNGLTAVEGEPVSDEEIKWQWESRRIGGGS